MLRIGNLPAGILDPTNPDSFVNSDGSLKPSLGWFKIVNGTWKDLPSVPILINKEGNYIEIRLTDGGPEDADGAVNGQIVDPGAPGLGTTSEAESDSGSSSNCFIATAAYGSFLEPEVMALRHFRDKYLMTTPLGKAFVAWYYRTSPPIAAFIAKHDTLRTATRVALAPVVFVVKYPLALVIGGVLIGVAGWRRRRNEI